MNYTKDELYLLWIDSFSSLEYNDKQFIYSIIKDKKSIKNAIIENKSLISERIGEEVIQQILASANDNYLKYLLNKLNRDNISVVTVQSKDYPYELQRIENPPLVLYAKGDLSLLDGENIFCIVGSRKSLPLALSVTHNIAKELVTAGMTLVTGIAEGVDETVLTTALEEEGKMISVLASGFDNIYPTRNASLVERVIEKGLVITEYPPSVEAKPYFFPVRNRIMSALAKGVLVTSGAIKSGTMHTAQYAGEYGKDIFAVPYSVGIKSGEGCNELIKRGAILVDKKSDILEYYGLESKEEEYVLTELEEQIVNILAEGEKHIEQIAKALNKQTFEIIPTLSVLELRRIVVKNGVNVFALSK